MSVASDACVPDTASPCCSALPLQVRLWNCETGEQLFALSVHQACVNTLAFDALGKRLYTGDGEGVVKELSCDTRGRASKARAPSASRCTPALHVPSPGLIR